jgi:endonuclease YncB( thermonuclease family)
VRPMFRPALAALLVLTASTASAETIAGQASVIDGDTIEIHGERIRILDIDAPELEQRCSLPKGGASWSCGQWAAHALSKWISPYSVTCETKGTDNLGRWRAHCNLAGVSIATWMAGQGWAVPNQDCQCEEIREASDQANNTNAGIWRGDFQMPWEWRKTQ